ALHRAGFRRQCLAMLEREYPGRAFKQVSNRSDREHSFSTWYTRGIAQQGRSAGWAFLGLSEEESRAAGDAVLAFGLIWLDWLRGHTDRGVMAGRQHCRPPPPGARPDTRAAGPRRAAC